MAGPVAFTEADIIDAVRRYVDGPFEGNTRAAARALKVKYETLYAWYKGTRSPKLSSIGDVINTLVETGLLKMPFNRPPQSSQSAQSSQPQSLDESIEKERLRIFAKRLDDLTECIGQDKLAAVNEYEFIPRAVAVAGAGESLQTEGGLSSLYAFRKEFLRREGINPKHALMMYVSGDSMEPTIMDKDTVLIDTGDKEPREGFIYVVSLGDTLMVKRLQRISNGWMLRSDNQKYGPVSVEGQEMEKMVIHGRVRWFSRVV